MLKSQSGIASIFIILLLLASIGVGVYLVQKQQIFKPKASEDNLQAAFTITDVNDNPLGYNGNNTFATNDLTVKIKLKDLNVISFLKNQKNLASNSIIKPAFAEDIPNDCSDKYLFQIGKNDLDFQTALGYARTEGACIYIPRGTYNIERNLKIPSNTIIFGDGIDRTILQITSNFQGDSLLESLPEKNSISENIVIRDLTLDGSAVKSGKNEIKIDGIAFGNIKNSYILNVKSNNFPRDGFYLGYYKPKDEPTIPLSRGSNNIRVSNCEGSNNGRNGISLTYGENNMIDNCKFEGNSRTSPGKVGIAGIALEPDSTLEVNNNQIIENTVLNNAYHGIFLQGCAANNLKVSENKVCFNEVKGSKAPYTSLEKNIIECKGENNTFVSNDMEIDPAGLGSDSKVGAQFSSFCDKPSSLPGKPNIGGGDGYSSIIVGKKIIKSISIDRKDWAFASTDFEIKLKGKKGVPQIFGFPIQVNYTDKSNKTFYIYFNYLNAQQTDASIPPGGQTCQFERTRKNSSDNICPFGRVEECTGAIDKKGKCKENKQVSKNCQDKRCVDYEECKIERERKNSSDKTCVVGRIEACNGAKKDGSNKCEINKYISKDCEDIRCVDWDDCTYDQYKKDSADEICIEGRVQQCNGVKKEGKGECKYNEYIETNCEDVRCIDWEEGCEYTEDAGEADDQCSNGYIQTCTGIKSETNDNCHYNPYIDPDCRDRRCK